MEYVSLYISPVVHLGETLKNDKEFVLKMIIKYHNCFNKIKTEFKNDIQDITIEKIENLYRKNLNKIVVM